MMQISPRWCKVLNVRTKGLCPELCLSLSIEDQEKTKEKEDTSVQKLVPPSGSLYTGNLHHVHAQYSMYPCMYMYMCIYIFVYI